MTLAPKLQQLLDQRGIRYKAAKQSFVADCLNVACQKEGHFYIRKHDGRSICFKCGVRWRWRELVAQICKCSVKEAYSVLFGCGAGDAIEEDLEYDLFDKPESILFEEMQRPDRPLLLGPDFVPIENSEAGLRYLASRGVTDPNLILAYDLHYHAWMNAVVFPIKRDGTIYGWQARKITPEPGEIRMVSCSFNKSRFLLNWDRAKLCKEIGLVEGPFDCAHIDIPPMGATASLGKGVSLDQIKLLLESDAEEIYLGVDPDAAEEVYEISQKLGTKKRVFRFTPPDSRKDFGESSESEVIEARGEARQIAAPADWLEVHFK